MKKLLKWTAKIAIVALFLSIIAPAMDSVQAASKITLKSGAAAPSTVYVNKTYSLKVSGTTVKFYSSNKKVATIGLTTGKMSPKAPGTVTITAKNKKTGKVVATKKFTVNQRATSIATDVTEVNLNPNETQTLKATKTPATSTDVVRFYSSDKTVATVGGTSGKITAKSNGTATITVYAKATKATANSSKYNKVATVTVNVGAVTDSAQQTSMKEITVVFKTDMSTYNLKPSDFTVINDETKATVSVSSIKVNKKEVTLTLVSDVADGKTYTVTYNKQTAQFTATDGKVASLSISPIVIPVAYQTLVYVELKDANGVSLGKYANGSNDMPAQISLSVKPSSGYINNLGLYLPDERATATVNATYHTWKYENGAEIGTVTSGDVVIQASASLAKPEKKEEDKTSQNAPVVTPSTPSTPSEPSTPSNPVTFACACTASSITLPNQADINDSYRDHLDDYSYAVSGSAISQRTGLALEYFAPTTEYQTLTTDSKYQVAVTNIQLLDSEDHDVTSLYYFDGKIKAINTENLDHTIMSMPAGTYRLRSEIKWKVNGGSEQSTTKEFTFTVTESPNTFDSKVLLTSEIKINQNRPYYASTEASDYKVVNTTEEHCLNADIVNQLDECRYNDLTAKLYTTTTVKDIETGNEEYAEYAEDVSTISVGGYTIERGDFTLTSETNQYNDHIEIDGGKINVVKHQFDYDSLGFSSVVTALPNGIYTVSTNFVAKSVEPGSQEFTVPVTTQFKVTGVPEVTVTQNAAAVTGSSIEEVFSKNLTVSCAGKSSAEGTMDDLFIDMNHSVYSYNEAASGYEISKVVLLVPLYEAYQSTPTLYLKYEKSFSTPIVIINEVVPQHAD